MFKWVSVKMIKIMEPILIFVENIKRNMMVWLPYQKGNFFWQNSLE